MEKHSLEAHLVKVGPFAVHDYPAQEMAQKIGELVAERRRLAAFALHVGGLNHRGDEEFVAAVDRAAVVYADGAAVVTLARMAGAERITRAATTDIGLAVIRTAREALGRTCRLALVGGEDGLSAVAAATLEASVDCEVTLAEHGYHSDDGELLEQLNLARPDILIVGLGMPYEAKWVNEHWESLPETLIMTCGGWFGFLAGHEKRAPWIMRITGTEWFYRLAQAPRRLAARYANGLISTVRLAPGQFKQKGKHVLNS